MAIFRENNISVMYVRNMFAMHSDLKHECLSVYDLGVLAGVGGVNLSDYTGRAGTEKAAFLVNGAVGGAATDGRLVTGAGMGLLISFREDAGTGRWYICIYNPTGATVVRDGIYLSINAKQTV